MLEENAVSYNLSAGWVRSKHSICSDQETEVIRVQCNQHCAHSLPGRVDGVVEIAAAWQWSLLWERVRRCCVVIGVINALLHGEVGPVADLHVGTAIAYPPASHAASLPYHGPSKAKLVGPLIRH